MRCHAKPDMYVPTYSSPAPSSSASPCPRPRACLCALVLVFQKRGQLTFNDLRTLAFIIRCSCLHWTFVLVMSRMIAGSRVVALLGDLVEDVVWSVLFCWVVRHCIGWGVYGRGVWNPFAAGRYSVVVDVIERQQAQEQNYDVFYIPKFVTGHDVCGEFAQTSGSFLTLVRTLSFSLRVTVQRSASSIRSMPTSETWRIRWWLWRISALEVDAQAEEPTAEESRGTGTAGRERCPRDSLYHSP